ncbi:OB-fold domain-containing protein [Aspergillus saccharolyticus JOP 1030-1]|uniref:CST complex subunit Stn1 N-terminal domain-containing protein n=1 Tax=Aspergillus saccharolyticus JOP 1030-1 TaxID=1450539 RepID=A0A318ZM10_9EURO|nr:hypothetical protein BP01DRAFT_297650 [Aspergillus saccharolyticus JOP 1030-1]PYH44870.1 hypothetical protein BP01DRAFT_297650 [Aspergillus saccharolyticus JOP 1030-1]
MATAENATTTLEFYPTYCFKASPTHFTWVKMAVADVLHLKRRAEYPDQATFFHLNHPIRFIAIAGIITSRTEYPRVTILTLDDSSGATMDIVVLKADPAAVAAPELPQASAEPEQQQQYHHISPTTHHPINITPLVPGTLALLKGTPSTYRQTVQLQLERCSPLHTTSAEMRFLDQRTRTRVEVLSTPWVLGADEVGRLRREADAEEERVEAEVARGQRRLRRRGAREEREYRGIMERWEAEERVREREAAAARAAGVELTRLLASIKQKRRRVDHDDKVGERENSRRRVCGGEQ